MDRRAPLSKLGWNDTCSGYSPDSPWIKPLKDKATNCDLKYTHICKINHKTKHFILFFKLKNSRGILFQWKIVPDNMKMTQFFKPLKSLQFFDIKMAVKFIIVTTELDVMKWMPLNLVKKETFSLGGREILKIINFWKDLWGLTKVWFPALG